MISNEQMDTLIGRLKVYGSESGRGKDHPNAIACRNAASVIIEQQAEIERLRGIVLRDAKRRMRDLTEWLNEDDANPIILRMAAEDADLQTLRTILGATK